MVVVSLCHTVVVHPSHTIFLLQASSSFVQIFPSQILCTYFLRLLYLFPDKDFLRNLQQQSYQLQKSHCLDVQKVQGFGSPSRDHCLQLGGWSSSSEQSSSSTKVTLWSESCIKKASSSSVSSSSDSACLSFSPYQIEVFWFYSFWIFVFVFSQLQFLPVIFQHLLRKCFSRRNV